MREKSMERPAVERAELHHETSSIIVPQPSLDIESDNEEENRPTVSTEYPNVVDWDGPDDPAKPINWSGKKKWANMGSISFITLLTPLASSMVAPGVPLVMETFHFTSGTLAGFVVSIYVLGFAVGPLFLAPISELFGRMIVYQVCSICFVIFTIACAVAPNLAALLVFRLLEGIAGSAPLTLGGGSIADLFRQEERGAAMGIFGLGPLLGPVIGPVGGGFLSEAKGWRWNFWVVAMAGGLSAVLSFLIQRETYGPVLLERKAKKLRKETGNTNLRSKLHPGIQRSEFFSRAIVRPMRMLFLSPIVFSLSVYMAIIYGYLYLLFTTFDLVYEGQYGFSQGTVGLTYLGLGIGSLLGLVVFGVGSDLLLKKLSAKTGNMTPEYRLPPLVSGSLLIPIGLFWYGWSAEAKVHWIVPILGTLFVGLGLIATFMPVQTYLVDVYTIHAASAIAANTLLRSLMGAFLPLAGVPMYNALGLGWGNSLIAFIALALAPMSLIFFRYGEAIRTRFAVKF